MNEVDDGGLMRRLWLELERTPEPGCREYVLEQLAEAALDLHDFSDTEIGEDVHAQFEELRRVREDYRVTSMRVGRLVAQMMEEHETRCKACAQADDSSTN